MQLTDDVIYSTGAAGGIWTKVKLWMDSFTLLFSFQIYKGLESTYPSQTPAPSSLAAIDSCKANIGYSGTLFGTSGSINGVTSSSGGDTWWFPTNPALCGTGAPNPAPGQRLYVLDLGVSATLGGTLTLHTCGGTTNYDTKLWISTNCPNTAQSFIDGCKAGT